MGLCKVKEKVIDFSHVYDIRYPKRERETKINNISIFFTSIPQCSFVKDFFQRYINICSKNPYRNTRFDSKIYNCEIILQEDQDFAIHNL